VIVKEKALQTLFYPGYDGEACRVDYGIVPSSRTLLAGADIVVVHSPKLGRATSLISSAEARDAVLNRILTTDLPDIRLDVIRFFVLFDVNAFDRTLGFEFPIALDFADYKAKGNRVFTEHPVPTSLLGKILWGIGIRPRHEFVRNSDVRAGGARCYTPFERRRHLDSNEVESLCRSIGHEPVGRQLPKWLTDQVGMTTPLREY